MGSPAAPPIVGSWIQRSSTPCLVASFLVCGASGAILWWDSHLHAVKAVHSWASVAMAIAVAVHLWKHTRALRLQFRRWPAWVAVGAAVLAATVLLIVLPDSRRGPRDGAGRAHRGWSR